MANKSLRLVEDKDVDKSKALDAALGQIERAFGKGSIMKLGKNELVSGHAIDDTLPDCFV